MSVKTRRSIDRCLSPRKGGATNIVVTILNWKVVIFALTIQRVSGTTNNDDYYAYDDYDEIDSEEEERIHELIVDEWYNLIRYLVGLSLCISGLIGLYFHQYASYYFLKRYTRPRLTEKRIGRVVLCEPLLSSTSIDGKNNGRKKKKKHKVKVISVRTSGGDGTDDSTTATSYVREEDLESHHMPEQHRQYDTDEGDSQQEFNDFRMLVIYKVPKPNSSALLCCSPSEKNMVINCTNSFANSCASGLTEVYEDTEQAINSYRNRSLPVDFDNCNTFEDFNGRINCSMDYMTMNGDCEYFKWFETSTLKYIDEEVDLILLKGKPTSACTPELLQSHLEQVGKAHSEEEKGFCKSIHMMGMSLVLAILVLSLVCYYEILEMPNPEVQRPLGYSVFGGFFGGSIVFAYLFARLLFAQYKQKVFLSAFTAPSSNARSLRRMSEASILTFPSTVHGMKRRQSEISSVANSIKRKQSEISTAANSIKRKQSETSIDTGVVSESGSLKL